MSIRLRTLSTGRVVALCAAETDPKNGDIYLDDAAHHALTEKFTRDFHAMGFMRGVAPAADAEADAERVRDAETELQRWIDTGMPEP